MYSHAAAITPHDTDKLGNPTRAIYVGGTGAVALTTRGGDEVTLAAVPVGTFIPVEALVVKSTGTTATNLVGLW